MIQTSNHKNKNKLNLQLKSKKYLHEHRPDKDRKEFQTLLLQNHLVKQKQFLLIVDKYLHEPYNKKEVYFIKGKLINTSTLILMKGIEQAGKIVNSNEKISDLNTEILLKQEIRVKYLLFNNLKCLQQSQIQQKQISQKQKAIVLQHRIKQEDQEKYQINNENTQIYSNLKKYQIEVLYQAMPNRSEIITIGCGSSSLTQMQQKTGFNQSVNLIQQESVSPLTKEKQSSIKIEGRYEAKKINGQMFLNNKQVVLEQKQFQETGSLFNCSDLIKVSSRLTQALENKIKKDSLNVIEQWPLNPLADILRRSIAQQVSTKQTPFTIEGNNSPVIHKFINHNQAQSEFKDDHPLKNPSSLNHQSFDEDQEESSSQYIFECTHLLPASATFHQKLDHQISKIQSQNCQNKPRKPSQNFSIYPDIKIEQNLCQSIIQQQKINQNYSSILSFEPKNNHEFQLIFNSKLTEQNTEKADAIKKAAQNFQNLLKKHILRQSNFPEKSQISCSIYKSRSAKQQQALLISKDNQSIPPKIEQNYNERQSSVEAESLEKAQDSSANFQNFVKVETVQMSMNFHENKIVSKHGNAKNNQPSLYKNQQQGLEQQKKGQKSDNKKKHKIGKNRKKPSKNNFNCTQYQQRMLSGKRFQEKPDRDIQEILTQSEEIQSRSLRKSSNPISKKEPNSIAYQNQNLIEEEKFKEQNISKQKQKLYINDDQPQIFVPLLAQPQHLKSELKQEHNKQKRNAKLPSRASLQDRIFKKKASQFQQIEMKNLLQERLQQICNIELEGDLIDEDLKKQFEEEAENEDLIEINQFSDQPQCQRRLNEENFCKTKSEVSEHGHVMQKKPINSKSRFEQMKINDHKSQRVCKGYNLRKKQPISFNQDSNQFQRLSDCRQKHNRLEEAHSQSANLNSFSSKEHYPIKHKCHTHECDKKWECSCGHHPFKKWNDLKRHFLKTHKNTNKSVIKQSDSKTQKISEDIKKFLKPIERPVNITPGMTTEYGIKYRQASIGQFFSKNASTLLKSL